MMDKAEYEMLSFMDAPREHAVKTRSTNALERLVGELKCRADDLGISSNENVVRRLVYALLMDHTPSTRSGSAARTWNRWRL